MTNAERYEYLAQLHQKLVLLYASVNYTLSYFKYPTMNDIALHDFILDLECELLYADRCRIFILTEYNEPYSITKEYERADDVIKALDYFIAKTADDDIMAFARDEIFDKCIKIRRKLIDSYDLNHLKKLRKK